MNNLPISWKAVKLFKKFEILSALICIVPMMLSGQNLTKPNIEGYFGASVNSYSGNLFYQRTDFFIPGRGISMTITFSYNSGKTALDYGFGCGWTFTYNLLYEKTSNQMILQTGDGNEQTFTWNGSTWDPEQGVFHELTEYQPGKFQIRTKHGTKYFFDDSTHKKITKIEDRNLNALLFSYSGSRLSVMTNACGKTLHFAWDGTGHLEQITDPNNGSPRIMQYKADLSPGGNHCELWQVIGPLADTINYSYGIWHNLTKITDARSKLVNIQYNPFKAVSSTGCPETGSIKWFSYDTVSRVTTAEEFVTSGNRLTNYIYDLQGRVTSIQQPTGIH